MQQARNGYAGTDAARPQREKVLFPANQPVRIQLEDGDGKLQAGAYGDQYRYWLTGNQIVWLEPAVHEAIQATTARPFDCYEITKSETRKGTKRMIAWHVEQVDDAAAEVIEPPAHVARAMREESDAREPGGHMPPARAGLDLAASAARLAEEAWTEGRTDTRPLPLPLPAPAPAPGPRLVNPPQERPALTGQHAAEAKLTECLLAAIRAAHAAEVYAQAQELAIRWTSEDVRAFGLSLYIAAEKGGR